MLMIYISISFFYEDHRSIRLLVLVLHRGIRHGRRLRGFLQPHQPPPQLLGGRHQQRLGQPVARWKNHGKFPFRNDQSRTAPNSL